MSEQWQTIWQGSFRGLHTALKARVDCRVLLSDSAVMVRWSNAGFVPKERKITRREILSAEQHDACIDLVALTLSATFGTLVPNPGAPVVLRRYRFEQSAEQFPLATLFGQLRAFLGLAGRPLGVVQSDANHVDGGAVGDGGGAWHCLEGQDKVVRRPQQQLVIVNPISGNKRGRHVWETVKQLFDAANVCSQVVVTSAAGEATELVRATDLSMFDALLVVGGDGTFNEVITGMLMHPTHGGHPARVGSGGHHRRGGDLALASDASARDSAGTSNSWANGCQAGVEGVGIAGGRRTRLPPVGVISAGTDSSLAKFVTHLHPLAAAAAVLTCGEVRPLDVLRLTWRPAPDAAPMERFAACGTAWGIPGQIAKESEALRGTWGVHRYALTLAKNLITLRPASGTIRIVPALGRDQASRTPCAAQCQICAAGAAATAAGGGAGAVRAGEEVVMRGQFLFAACLKTERTVTPFCHASDGCCDVFVIQKLNHLSLGSLWSSVDMKSGKHLRDDKFHYFKALECSFTPESDKDPFNVDGEIGQAVPTHITVLPCAVDVYFANGCSYGAFASDGQS